MSRERREETSSMGSWEQEERPGVLSMQGLSSPLWTEA